MLPTLDARVGFWSLSPPLGICTVFYFLIPLNLMS